MDLQDIKETTRELLHRPWTPPGALATGGLCAFFLLTMLLVGTHGWVPWLDGPNLLFHEAGHPIFGIFGSEVLGALGGTLMQLLVPAAIAIAFYIKRQATGTAFAVFWTCQSLKNVSVYVNDARSQLLDLIGGGEHDWAYLLDQWNILRQDHTIALVMTLIAWLGMWGMLLWLPWRWWAGRVAGPNTNAS